MAPSEPPPAARTGASEPQFRAWMDRYGPGLRRYFQRRADPAEADDLEEEVSMAMHRRVEGTPIDNVEGYLFRVAAGVLSKRAARAGRHQGLDGIDRALDIADELSPERRLIG